MPHARRATARSNNVGRTIVPLLKAGVAFLAVLGLSFAGVPAPIASGASAGSVSVANSDASVVDPAGFADRTDVSVVSGACAANSALDAATLPDDDWSFLVSASDGTPLSSDDVTTRAFTVSGGVIVSTAGGHATRHTACPSDPSNAVAVALSPYAGGSSVDRLTVAPTSRVQACLATGDATGFGCSTVQARSTTFTIAGSQHATVSASAASSHIASGATVVDQASVTVASGTATGTIVFSVCAAASCDTGGTVVGSASLVSGSATSPAYAPPSDGTYTFRAEYWGDASHAAAADAGPSQTFTAGAVGSPSPSGSASASPSAGGSPSVGPSGSPSASASGGPGSSGSTPPSGSPSATGTPGPTGTPRPTATPAPIITPAPEWTGPILTGTPPPPPPRPPVTAEPSYGPVNYPSSGCNPVCYGVSPTFFGPGWDYPVGGSPGAGAGGPNQSAVTAYGPGGVPHFPGINTPATPAPTGGVAGAVSPTDNGTAGSGGSAAPGAPNPSDPGSNGVESTTDVVASVDGLPVAVAPSQDAQAMGAGASGAGISLLPAEAAAAIATPGGSAAASNGGQDVAASAGDASAVPAATGTPTIRSTANIPLVVVVLVIVAGAIASWAVRTRRIVSRRKR